MTSCCTHRAHDTQCRRKTDDKVFSLPRKFSRKRCLQGVSGFTMRSSCAPYQGCAKTAKKKRNKQRGKGTSCKPRSKHRKLTSKRRCGVKSSTDRCVNSAKKSRRCYRSIQTNRCRKLKPKCSVRASSGRCVNDTKGTRRCVRNSQTRRCRKRRR